jgi:hypothetical protein
MNKRSFFTYLIFGILAITQVAETVALSHCHDHHHKSISSKSESDCCNSALNEKDHTHEPDINSNVFISSNNNRPSFQFNFAKLFINEIQLLHLTSNSSNFHPKNLPDQLPDDLSFKSTVVLLI